MAKIWTSRFSNPELKSGEYTVVGIVRSLPRFPLKYTLAGNIMDIAPPRSLFKENNQQRFAEPYCRNLDRIGFAAIDAQICHYLAQGKDVVLCCYEDVRKGPHNWCHRIVFADWWLRQTGERIEELKDSSKFVPEPGFTPKKTEEKTPQFTEVSLF
nr:MAG TPA: protein of unknown function DUF488 [Bacteriophage sp.]